MLRTIENLINTSTSEIIYSKDLLNTNFVDKFQLRKELEEKIQQNDSLYVCAICNQKVKLKGGIKRDLYFAHLKDSKFCPIKTNSRLTKKELETLIYHGLKESYRHINLKNRLFEVLNLDSRFLNTQLETVIKDFNEKKRWKKPDIQTIYNNKRIIFELQISNTFLSVIVARELFYKDNEMPLIWVFDKFDPRFIQYYQCDIFCHHNCNVIVFDDIAYKQSIIKKRLLFSVYYLIPELINGVITPTWNSEPEIIDFDQIQLKNNQAFYFDYTGKANILSYGNKANVFSAFIEQYKDKSLDIGPLKHELMKNFSEECKDISLDSDIIELRILICTLYSLEKTNIYGYGNGTQSIIWLINIVYDRFKPIFWIVLNYLEKKNLTEEILHKDKKGLLKNKITLYKQTNVVFENKYRKLLHAIFYDIE